MSAEEVTTIKGSGSTPVPTLYIRNLNDKISPEGKWACSLTCPYRNQNHAISLVQHVGGGNSGENSKHLTTKRLSLYCIQGSNQRWPRASLAAELRSLRRKDGKCFPNRFKPIVNRTFNMLDPYLMKLDSKQTLTQKALSTSAGVNVKPKLKLRSLKGDQNWLKKRKCC